MATKAQKRKLERLERSARSTNIYSDGNNLRKTDPQRYAREKIKRRKAYEDFARSIGRPIRAPKDVRRRMANVAASSDGGFINRLMNTPNDMRNRSPRLSDFPPRYDALFSREVAQGSGTGIGQQPRGSDINRDVAQQLINQQVAQNLASDPNFYQQGQRRGSDFATTRTSTTQLTAPRITPRAVDLGLLQTNMGQVDPSFIPIVNFGIGIGDAGIITNRGLENELGQNFASLVGGFDGVNIDPTLPNINVRRARDDQQGLLTGFYRPFGVTASGRQIGFDDLSFAQQQALNEFVRQRENQLRGVVPQNYGIDLRMARGT